MIRLIKFNFYTQVCNNPVVAGVGIESGFGFATFPEGNLNIRNRFDASMNKLQGSVNFFVLEC